MNKKQIEQILEEYINIEIQTPLYTSNQINAKDIDFPFEGVLRISNKVMNEPHVYLQIKDIKIIKGVVKR